MTPCFVIFGVLLAGQATPEVFPLEHERNPVYRELRSRNFSLGGAHLPFPAPILGDGESAEAERGALVRLAGSDRALAEFTRDSVSAPLVVKTRDEPSGDAGVVRVADLWFVVRGGLDEIDPARVGVGKTDGQTVEAGNMRFRVDRLDLPAAGVEAAEGSSAWFVHLTGRLLDRIHVEATDRVVATKADESWLIAARTERSFDGRGKHPNLWRAVARKGDVEHAGKDEPYPGGAGYVKVRRLKSVPGTLLVESHIAFFEPRAWFDGKPILKSKIALVAQDRVRALRRERKKSRVGEKTGRPSGAKEDCKVQRSKVRGQENQGRIADVRQTDAPL